MITSRNRNGRSNESALGPDGSCSMQTVDPEWRAHPDIVASDGAAADNDVTTADRYTVVDVITVEEGRMTASPRLIALALAGLAGCLAPLVALRLGGVR
jgi:hypothetical protein